MPVWMQVFLWFAWGGLCFRIGKHEGIMKECKWWLLAYKATASEFQKGSSEEFRQARKILHENFMGPR